MKARVTKGACGWCGGLLMQGTQIALVDDQGWQHVQCVRKQQSTYWSDAYTPGDAEAERRHHAEQMQAVEWLRAVGRKVGLRARGTAVRAAFQILGVHRRAPSAPH